MAAQPKPQPANKQKMTPRPATYLELQNLLGKRPEQLQQAIGLPEAQLMLPVDGRGARVLVGVQQDKRNKIPAEVTLDWHGQRLVIPLEIDEKYLPATIF